MPPSSPRRGVAWRRAERHRSTSRASPFGGSFGYLLITQNLRRIFAAVALATLVGLHPEFWSLPLTFFRWQSLHDTLTARPNGTWPEYPLFLEEVRAHTHKGDRIAVVVPAMSREETYSYAYYRASYVLAGREVLPLYYRTLPRPENLARAEYLAVWHASAPRARIVWSGHGGVLLSRR